MVDDKIDFVRSLTKSNNSGTKPHVESSRHKTKKMIMEKVLSDERTTAHATSISVINSWFLDCKECNWYKSEQNILSEERLSI